MKEYTIHCGGELTEGIEREKDGFVYVGEKGRGRELVKVKLVNPPTDGHYVLLRDQSGYRGGWEAHMSEGVRVLARGYCAQGAAGYMGGGPEYFLVMPPGSKIFVERSGRLYGQPKEFVVEATEEGIFVRFPETIVEV